MVTYLAHKLLYTIQTREKSKTLLKLTIQQFKETVNQFYDAKLMIFKSC